MPLKECAISFFAFFKINTWHASLNWLHSRKSKWRLIIMCSYLISTLKSWELWLQLDCKAKLTLAWAVSLGAGGYMRDHPRQGLLGTKHEVKLKMEVWWAVTIFPRDEELSGVMVMVVACVCMSGVHGVVKDQRGVRQSMVEHGGTTSRVFGFWFPN